MLTGMVIGLVFGFGLLGLILSARHDMKVERVRVNLLQELLDPLKPVSDQPAEVVIARHGMFVDCVWGKISGPMRTKYSPELTDQQLQEMLYHLAAYKVQGTGRWKVYSNCGEMKLVTPGACHE